MVKVLYFVDRMLRGGIQTFVYENVKYMDKSVIQIDFLLLDDGQTYNMEEDLRNLGCNVFKLNGIWIKKPYDYIKYYLAMDAFFKQNHDYDVVHLHSSSKNFLFLYIAKKYGIKTRIAHSHNIDFQTKSKMKIMAGNIMKPLLINNATDFFACSELAGKWLFGNRQVTIVKNAVDIERFRFDEIIAKEMREKLGYSDQDIVIGHVGRFTRQKNHDFLIDIFKEAYKRNPKYKLLLIGTGELEEKIQDKVKKLELEKVVRFYGFHSDVEKYMQAMDIFVFPSLFEGLGLVLIEAQASGLNCYASQGVIPEEAKASELMTFVNLDDGAIEWVNKIGVNKNRRQMKYIDSLIKNGYSIQDTSLFLQEYYIGKATCKK